MVGHKICFYGEMWLIIPELSLLLLLIWSSALLHLERPQLCTILAFLSAIGSIAKKNTLKCMPYLPFSFSDEQFNQNGEKKV